MQLPIRSRDRHNIPPFLYKIKLNLKLDTINQRNCNYVQSFQLYTANVLISIVRTVSFFLSFLSQVFHFFERLILCQSSFWVIPIHHSDLGDACPVLASAVIHCPPVTRVDDHC